MNLFLKTLNKIKKCFKKEKIRFNITNNVPTVSVKIGSKKLEMMIDTGADYSVIDISLLPYIKGVNPNIKKIGEDELATGFGDTQIVEIYEIPIIINDRLYFIKCTFANLGIIEVIKESNNLDIIGMLGCDFFDNYKFLLNFYDKTLSSYYDS